MIVIDLGCAEHGGEGSIETLITRFHPRVYYGFDPHPHVATLSANVAPHELPKKLVIEQAAAWTHEGTTGFQPRGLRSQVGEELDAMTVPCFDLAAFIEQQPIGERLIVKMDVEGAEKPLLEHLIARRVDDRISLLLIEWHDHREFVEPFDREDLISRLRCPVQEWH